MKVYGQPIELMVDVPAATRKSSVPVSIDSLLGDTGLPVDDIRSRNARIPLPRPKKGAAMQKSAPASGDRLYVRTGISDAELNPWDAAHMAAKKLGTNAGFIEPDMSQEFSVDANRDLPFKKSKAPAEDQNNNGYDPDWMPKKSSVWHLGDDFSELKSAREAVADLKTIIRIGHLDTGYGFTHPVISADIKTNKLQRSFIEGEDARDAHDRLTTGTLRMPGHGTGTLGVLCGDRIRIPTDDGMFDDYLGGAPFAEVICCRIAKSVVLFKSSSFADALFYLTQLTRSGTPVHVVSMSMGGAPARAWATAINEAYMAGITLVTAAGNNFNGLPIQHVVYPARYSRVIAACGATYDNLAYSSKKLGEMSGCFGPDRYMGKALAAYTPNLPWASAATRSINFSGAGTSCATPQIAAAAAIYYRKWHAELSAMLPWQRVEVIRNALYKSAKKKVADGSSYKRCFGNGILRANRALAIAPDATGLSMSEEATMPWFPVISTIFKAKPGKRMEMYQTELAQLVYQYPELRAEIDDDTRDYSKVSAKKWARFQEAVLAHPAASVTLKQAISKPS